MKILADKYFDEQVKSSDLVRFILKKSLESYSLTQLKAVVELFGYQAISIENKDSFLDEVITNLPERAPIEGSCNYYIQKRIYL